MLARFCALILKALGWSLEIDRPRSRKYVLVVYPHTSNWDFLLGICAAKAIRLDAHYIAKHTLFKKPYGWIFRALGGIPVDRARKDNRIRQIVDRFNAADRFVLGLAPEGTRARTDHWKSGFYHIARAADVPIVMAYLDYGKKRVGMGGEFRLGDDLQAVYGRIAAFYRDCQGKNPAQAGTIAPGQP